ncbi:hypothetical protein [Burkholderia cepacia]|uniref:hypothetical protein n=1 Tax=Burkholderia cepacia TaxID=292 RepID=UPI001CF0F821|nr:hypothetical protein [Burkholderia cepacia]MCA8348424.1 hypothetical protein [Burkholderia cepacia]
MKALIKARLLCPSIVLPLAALMELIVERDFNLGQVALIVVARAAQEVVSRSSLFCGHSCDSVC